MVSKLPEADPCFVVFDFHDATADGRVVKKLALIKWCVLCLGMGVVRPAPCIRVLHGRVWVLFFPARAATIVCMCVRTRTRDG